MNGTDRTQSDATTDLGTRMARIERTNARLRVSLVGVGMLMVGLMLGGLIGEPERDRVDDVVAYTATDRTMYRVYESGRIEYLRLDKDPPRSADGIFGWGQIKIDPRYTLTERP